MKTIARQAYLTGARCRFGSMVLTVGHAFGYTPTKSTAKKAVAGCRSPKARGAEPHPARFAAFLFLATSFGGPNGRAQALPVTLRVPRSLTPVRAAAQCRSWSAVVHLAQLEINMTSITTPGKTAQIFAHPNLFSPPVQQGRLQGRHPKGIACLRRARYSKRDAAYKAAQLVERIDAYRCAIAQAEGYATACRLTLSELTQAATAIQKGATHA